MHAVLGDRHGQISNASAFGVAASLMMRRDVRVERLGRAVVEGATNGSVTLEVENEQPEQRGCQRGVSLHTQSRAAFGRPYVSCNGLLVVSAR